MHDLTVLFVKQDFYGTFLRMKWRSSVLCRENRNKEGSWGSSSSEV